MIVNLQGLTSLFLNFRNDFEIEIDDSLNLSNLYFTFDSIYLLKPDSNHHLNQVEAALIYDLNSKSFQPLEYPPSFRLISVCSNTNYFWALGVVHDLKSSSKFCLLQYSNRFLAQKFEIGLNDFPTNNRLQDLVVQSTDVNVYIFDNSSNGLICLYQLRKQADLDENQTVKENQLNESSTSCLPLNQLLIDTKVSQFACGKEHILFLSDSTTPGSTSLFSFGIGTKGQLGLGKIENRYELTPVKTPPGVRIRSISAGGWHSGFVTADTHECYLWGWNLNGQISMCGDNDSVFVVSPTKLVVLDDLTGQEVKFIHVSLGARHSGVLDSNGNVYMFGWNKYGQIFTDSENLFDSKSTNEKEEEEYNVETPVKIEKLCSVKELKCSCWLTAITTL